MNSPKKRPTTYRLTPELDSIITKEAKKLGVSKNALVQVKLAEVFSNKPNQTSTPPSMMLAAGD